VSSSTGITSSLADVSGESLFDNIHAMLPFDTMSVISKAPLEKARGSAQTGLPFYSRSCPGADRHYVNHRGCFKPRFGKKMVLNMHGVLHRDFGEPGASAIW
jgi:hypothetical protein